MDSNLVVKKVLRIFLIFFIIFIVLFFSIYFLDFADEKLHDESKSNVKEYTGFSVEDYVDPDTGVHYLIYCAGYKGGISVRYNSDGSIMVED